MKKIAFIGEAMIELSHQTERMLNLSFAGDTLNAATYLARLLPATQAKIHYVTALGDEPYSDTMLHDWQQENINTELVVQLTNKLPGLYLIRTDKKGERYFYFYRAQSAARELFKNDHTDQLCHSLTQMDYLYFSAITLAIFDEESRARLFNVLIDAKQQGAKIFFDTNYRPRLWPDLMTTQKTLKKFASLADIIFPTLADERAMFNDQTPDTCAKRYHQWGIKEVVVKCDADPCFISTPEKQCFIPAEKVEKIIDATAAGDSFNAGYLAARLQNLSPEESAKHGHRIASVVIQHKGAIIPRELMPKSIQSSL